MQPPSDLLIDRKRLKAHLVGWRTLAILVIFGSIGFYTYSVDKNAFGAAHTDYIAQLTIDDVMVDDPKRDALMKEILEDDHAKALLVRLDSPGGTTVAGEEIFLQLREIAAKKPVVGVMHTVCASACYMAALATDHVVARYGTLTGSIGVLLQSVEVSELADKIGVHSVSIKSGPYKDVPDIAEPLSDDQRKVVSQLVMDAYDGFIGMLVERRGMDEAHARALADGRVYTGHQAVNLKLIDGLGGDKEALAWLAETKKINPDLELREIKPEGGYTSLLDQMSQYTGVKIFSRAAIGLDGLVSIWHPSGL